MDTDVDAVGDLARNLPALLERAGIQHLHCDVLTKRHSFKGADVSPRAQEITGPAREEHRRRHFGFWEYVLSGAIDADFETRAGLIEGALRHNSGGTIHMQMSLAEFTDSLRRNQFADLPPRTIVSLTSSVETASAPTADWHLPMLDMGAPVGPAGQAACLDALQGLGLTGLLFDSGKSYHFFADRVLSEQEFWTLLARAQLLSPIVDARWIAHQLLDGHAALRISTDSERHHQPHHLAAEVV